MPLLGHLAAVLLAADSGALHVDQKADAELPCAANAALEQAIKVRLPRVRLGKGRLSASDLSARISATPGGFRFEVRRADGSVAMSRDLFSGCAQLGDTSALILDRYLAQISWAGRDVGLVAQSPPPPVPKKPDPLPPPPLVIADAGSAPEPVDAGTVEPETAVLVSRIGQTPEPSGNEPISAPAPPPPPPDAGTPVINLPPPSPREPFVTAVELSAGGGVWYGNQAVGAFSLDLSVVLRERVRLALLGLVGLPATTPVPRDAPRGTVQSVDLGVFAMLGLCTKSTLQLCGNALGGARLTRGAAFNSDPSQAARLFSTTSGWISVPEVGLLARLAYAIGGRLLLALDVMAGVPLIRGALKVEGFSDLLNPLVDVSAQLRVGVRL